MGPSPLLVRTSRKEDSALRPGGSRKTVLSVVQPLLLVSDTSVKELRCQMVSTTGSRLCWRGGNGSACDRVLRRRRKQCFTKKPGYTTRAVGKLSFAHWLLTQLDKQHHAERKCHASTPDAFDELRGCLDQRRYKFGHTFTLSGGSTVVFPTSRSTCQRAWSRDQRHLLPLFGRLLRQIPPSSVSPCCH